jgi:CheY-like chemotaxis protein
MDKDSLDRKIYIVDHVKERSEKISELLTDAGIERVYLFNDPAQAIAAISEKHVCIAFVASSVNNMSGKELLDQIRAKNRYCKGFIISENPGQARIDNPLYPVISNRDRPVHSLAELLKLLIREISCENG